MAALVLHYDQSETNVCEATGMVNLNKGLEALLAMGHRVIQTPLGIFH